MNGCSACTSSEDARPSRKNPPVGVPLSRKKAGVSDAYISDGALRKPGISMFGPPSGTGSPWSVAGFAVKALEATWHVAQDCLPDTDRLLSLNSAFPAVAASERVLVTGGEAPPPFPPPLLPLSPPQAVRAELQTKTSHALPRDHFFLKNIDYPSRPRPVQAWQRSILMRIIRILNLMRAQNGVGTQVTPSSQLHEACVVKTIYIPQEFILWDTRPKPPTPPLHPGKDAA